MMYIRQSSVWLCYLLNPTHYRILLAYLDFSHTLLSSYVKPYMGSMVAPECLKGFIGCTARPIGPLYLQYSPLRGLFTAPWNDL